MQFPFRSPKLSVIVVGYKMPAQLENTLFTLSAGYQREVRADEYEVIVVENESVEMLSRKAAHRLGSNIRYYSRKETNSSPVNAINFGVSKARAKHVAIMIDGARMVTPHVLKYMIEISSFHKNSVISIPGYHLGGKLQQDAVNEGYDQFEEARLMSTVNWFKNGYELFKIACFSGSSARGYFTDLSESNCLCVSKKLYWDIGGMDPNFDSHGGGFANLDLYKRLLEFPQTQLFLLFGEGCFHQFHGGVTTGASKAARQQTMLEITEQYERLRGVSFRPAQKQAIFYGRVEDNVWPFIKDSINQVCPHAA